MTQEYIGIKKIIAWPQDSANGEMGYAVKYEDGYISWSPKKVFESAYIPIDTNCNVNINITTERLRSLAGSNS